MRDNVVVLSMENTADVAGDEIIGHIRSLKDEGFRFITMSAVDVGEDISLLYHFDKDLQVRNLKVGVPKGKNVPSVSSVFLAAFLVENEIKEQFGVDFDGLPVDFRGMLYNDEEVRRTPFCKISISRTNTN